MSLLTHDHFRPLLQSEFALGTDLGAVPVQLVEVEKGRWPAMEGGRVPFSALFLGPPGLTLLQGTYEVRHPALGELDMFLVPVGVTDERMAMSATFA